MAKLRIGIDARLLGPADRGLGRYTMELLSILAPLRKNFDFTVFLHTESTEANKIKALGYKIVAAPFRPYSFAEQIYFPKLIRQAKVDLMHFTHFNVPVVCPVPHIITIHDLILHHFPSRLSSTRSAIQYWSKYLLFRLMFRWVIERAYAIVAVSSFTAEDLHELYPQAEARLTVIKEPVPDFIEFGANDRNMFLSYTKARPYAVVVGAFYPHKNIARLLRCWKSLEKNMDLLLIGREDSFSESLKQVARQLNMLDEPGGVRFMGCVNDADLRAYYDEAAFVIVPSLWEGVGLPGIEAIARGAKVISSAAAGLPEAYGTRAYYMPVDNDDNMAQALGRAIDQSSPWPSGFSAEKTISPKEVRESFKKIYSDFIKFSHEEKKI